MSNFKELLFMEDDEWMEVTAKIEHHKEQLKQLALSGERWCRGAHYSALHHWYQKREEIEKRILSEHNRKAMAFRGSLDSAGDDYIVAQIIKNGYLTGFKF